MSTIADRKGNSKGKSKRKPASKRPAEPTRPERRGIGRPGQPWQDNPWLVLGLELHRMRSKVEEMKGVAGLDKQDGDVLYHLREAQAGCLACGANLELVIAGAYMSKSAGKAGATC